MCDLCFREFSSEENFLKFGKSLPNVIKLQMSSHSELKEVFIENIQAMCTDISCSLCDQVHSFWMEKFCNVRIKDYMDAKERLNISKSDKITTRTQNLRDGLLTNHVASSSNKWIDFNMLSFRTISWCISKCGEWFVTARGLISMVPGGLHPPHTRYW